jgi:7,8-dihydro-6-hydroxymethylpterin-pyrophosphokinase
MLPAVFLALGSNLGDRERNLDEARGRVRGVRNGPRGLDVDILFYGDVRRECPRLVLTHPCLHTASGLRG